jgi:hypothetical protein
VISGYRRGVNEIFVLLVCYAALICNYLPTFVDNPSVPFSRVKQSEKTAGPLKMGPIWWPEGQLDP